MRRTNKYTWRRCAWIAVTLVCVVYAPIAMTMMWPYANPGAPALGESLLARGTSPAFVAEAVADRLEPYRHSLGPMILHTVVGGLLMLLGPAQLLTARRRRVRLHRGLGILFAVSVYASMTGAAIYLARTAPEDAFSGAAFWIALATILVGTVQSVTFGIVAVLGGFPQMHQRWMLLCYGFLLSAPLLRLEWGLLAPLMPQLSLAEINRMTVMHLGLVCAFGALVASRTMDRSRDVEGVNGTWVPWPLIVLAHLAGAAALTWVTPALLDAGAAGRRMLVAYLLPLAAAYAVMAVCGLRAGRQGRTWAREEWRIHLAALCLAPALSAGTVPVLERMLDLDRHTALTAGLTIGCGFMASMATTVVGMRLMYARVLVKHAAATEPEAATAPVEAALADPEPATATTATTTATEGSAAARDAEPATAHATGPVA